jgi:hypothetical protein
MIAQLLFAFGLISVTVIIHALGTLEAIAHLIRVRRRTTANDRLWVAEIQIVRVVAVLMLLHLLEAGVWAGFYFFSGLLPELETAIYFSVTSYTTVGYGDVVLPPHWRLVGPIEAAAGILMFGWSTAIIVAAVTRIHLERLRTELDAQPKPENLVSEER